MLRSGENFSRCHSAEAGIIVRFMAKPGANIYAFFGSDDGQVKEAAMLLSRKIAPKDDEFGLEIVNGSSDNSDHAARIVSETIQAIQTLPFFGGDKVVWLQGANFFGDSQTGKAQATLSAVESLLELLEAGLPPDVKLIISASEVDKRRTFYKKINKLGEVKIFDKVDISKAGWETKVMSWVSGKARELNLTFDGQAMERFVLTVGADTRMLENELEKLSLFTAGRPATEDDIRQIAAATHAGVIFEIGDAIARKNLPLTLSLIDAQLRRGENAVGILLAAIVPRVRSLLHATDLVERHGIRAGRNYRGFEAAVNALPPGETAHLPRKKDGGISAYPLFLAAQDTGKFSLAELKNAIEACLEANLRLVTTSLEPQLVLSQLVARILQDA